MPKNEKVTCEMIDIMRQIQENYVPFIEEEGTELVRSTENTTTIKLYLLEISLLLLELALQS